MHDPQVSFQIRINDSASLEEIGARVEQALQCQFSPSTSNFFSGEPALESFCLGLWITLSCEMQLTENSDPTNYALMGTLRGDLEATWEDNYSIISISQYILAVMKKLDSETWYIPDSEELYLEAGLTPE
jgi:hypothetical protein